MRNLEESDPRRQESGKVASRGWGRGRVYWILSFCFARRKEFRLHNKVTLLNTTEQRCSKTCLTIVNFMWCVFYHNFKKCSLGGTTRLYVPRYGLHWDVHSPGYEARFFFFFLDTTMSLNLLEPFQGQESQGLEEQTQWHHKEAQVRARKWDRLRHRGWVFVNRPWKSLKSRRHPKQTWPCLDPKSQLSHLGTGKL